MKNKFIKLPLFLAAVTLIFTVLLSIVYQITITKINDDANVKANQAYVDMFTSQAKINVTGVDGYAIDAAKAGDAKYSLIIPETDAEGKVVVAKIIKDSSGVAGYAFRLKSNGFQSKPVEYLIGFDKTGTISCFKVLDVTSQTAGYGLKYNDEGLQALLRDYLKANPSATKDSFTKAENANIVAGATVTGKAFVEGYAAAKVIVSEIKGA